VSRRKKRPRRSTRRPATIAPGKTGLADSRPAESRLAEVATVAWMLSTLVTLGAEVLAAALGIWRAFQPGNSLAAAGCELFAFCALVVGIVSLMLTWAVRRLRRVLPPRPVTSVALIVGAVPLLMIWLLLLF
jgi:hypothetical protein